MLKFQIFLARIFVVSNLQSAWVRLIDIDVAEVRTGWGRMAQEKMEVIVRYELTCRLTGEKFNRMEVGYCTTPDGTDIAQAIVARRCRCIP